MERDYLINLIKNRYYFTIHIMNPYENPNEKRLNFLKHKKTRFRENFDFRGFIVTLMHNIQKWSDTIWSQIVTQEMLQDF